ncbi:MAG: starch synthase [Desulfuromonadales bacterium GWD2_61_12]|nr:MAG: starch synthase [Desulfuromonadales bacterium GWC2_61_20]OGR34511.1 MAG: starch synthase [Desulfuromonadales bacterium GWD2_61_12]HAD03873.1 glycogen synthase GlgA [Desulfuromonas sp.]
MKILLVASEAAPFAKTGGLADVAGSLPLALRALGHDVRLILPWYQGVAAAHGATAKLGPTVTVTSGIRHHSVTLRQLQHQGLTVYFVDCPELFDRPGLYGDTAGDYPDNPERFGVFCRAVLQALEQLDFVPAVIHVNDWQSALIPVLLRTERRDDPLFAAIATVMTIHNLGYQGLFSQDILTTLGLSPALYGVEGLEYFGHVSLLKGGIVFADLVTTVSPTYCREIQTPGLGHGFDGLLRRRAADLHGVLNGLDPAQWNPAQAGSIPFPYSSTDLRPKGLNKRALQRELGLDVRPEQALVALVTRIDPQKGLDLVAEAAAELMTRPLQLVLLGSGERGLSESLAELGRRHPGRISVNLHFDEGLARRIYAASDLFLMPSRYEPCGLGQLIALRYGAVPVVRRTGGLADTVIDPRDAPRLANGFHFGPATPEALVEALDRALAAREKRRSWLELVRRGMNQDFSWDRSARRYLELYRLAMENARV